MIIALNMKGKTMNDLQVKRLTSSAILPTRGSDGAAGLDLYADGAADAYPGDVVSVSTGIAVAIPHGYVGLVWPRSGLAAKRGVQVLGGVIDSDYRGEVRVMLTSTAPIKINPGDRIAQLLIQPVGMCGVKEVSELPGTARGVDGFGSTGV